MSDQYQISDAASFQEEMKQSIRAPKVTIRPASAQQIGRQPADQKRPTTAKLKSPQLISVEQNKEKTIPFFKDSKVVTSAHVVLVGGVPKAVPFYQPLKKTSAELMTKLGVTQSFSQQQFNSKSHVTIGSKNKPLVAYHPDAQRNRMLQPIMKMPQNNESQIQFGDGNRANVKRTFVSSAKNNYGNHANFGFTSNPAILQAMTQKHKAAQHK